jgi:hypothetical protein
VLAKEVTFNVSLVLLILAVVLFVLAAFPKVARLWMVAIGLACFAGAFLVDRLF